MVSEQTWLRIAAGGLVICTVLVTSRNATSLHTTNAANGYYATCDDARRAGVTPIMRDEPGYRPELDPNGNGVACEAWSRG